MAFDLTVDDKDRPQTLAVGGGFKHLAIAGSEAWPVLASRQQTASQFFGDVLMEYGLGRAIRKDYPPPTTGRPR